MAELKPKSAVFLQWELVRAASETGADREKTPAETILELHEKDHESGEFEFILWSPAGGVVTHRYISVTFSRTFSAGPDRPEAARTATASGTVSPGLASGWGPYFEALARQRGLHWPSSIVISADAEVTRELAPQGITTLHVRSTTEPSPPFLPGQTGRVVVLMTLADALEWVRLETEARQRMPDYEGQIAGAAARIRSGGLVAFPTETVYGLGANALDPRAVARVFEVKGRPHFDPLIVHVAEPAEIERCVQEVPPLARRLIERFWPGPLTLVLRKRPYIPEIVTAGLSTVAVRCPGHPVAWRLLHEAQVPIAAPSANRFGRISPTTAEAVRQQLGESVDDILDGGPCPVGVESTVVAVEHDELVILRPGGVSPEDLRSVATQVRFATTERRPRSPGQLPSHYAPMTPLYLVDQWPAPDLGIGVLTFDAPPEGRYGAVEVLSAKGDLREAAARFFETLRRLDACGLRAIYARPLPNRGLGVAINDRLARAAHGAPG